MSVLFLFFSGRICSLSNFPSRTSSVLVSCASSGSIFELNEMMGRVTVTCKPSWRDGRRGQRGTEPSCSSFQLCHSFWGVEVKAEHHPVHHTECQQEGHVMPCECCSDTWELRWEEGGGTGSCRGGICHIPGVAGIVFLLSQGNNDPNELMHVLIFEGSTVTHASINNNGLSSDPSS